MRAAPLRPTIAPWIFAVWLLLGQSVVSAATLDVLVDLDSDTSTGCSATTPGGPFAGVESIVTTTIDTSVYPPAVTGVTTQGCAGGVFGPSQPLDPGGWPVGVGSGAAGYDVIETYFPDSTPYGEYRLGFVYSDPNAGASDWVFTTDGGGTGSPILLGGEPIVVVPTLAHAGLVLLALALAFVALRHVRRNTASMFLAGWLVALAAGAGGAAILLDGAIGDWVGIAAVATDPLDDAPGGVDLAAVHATQETPRVYVRADVKIVTPPQPFAFTDQAGVLRNAVVESDVLNITGLNTPLPLSLAGGEYRLDGGTYTTTPGTLTNNQTVQLRLTASGALSTSVDAVLTIGTASDTFTVTTEPACAVADPPYGGDFEVLVDAWADYAEGEIVPVQTVNATTFRILSTNNPFIANEGTSYMEVTVDPVTGHSSVASNECFNYGPGFCLDVVGNGTATCDGDVDLVLDFGGFTSNSFSIRPAAP